MNVWVRICSWSSQIAANHVLRRSIAIRKVVPTGSTLKRGRVYGRSQMVCRLRIRTAWLIDMSRRIEDPVRGASPPSDSDGCILSVLRIHRKLSTKQSGRNIFRAGESTTITYVILELHLCSNSGVYMAADGYEGVKMGHAR